LCIKRRSFEGELQIARNCHFLPLNADFTGNTLATEFLVSSARFHQKFWMRRVRIGGFKSTRIRSKKNLLPGREFFRSPIPPPGASFFARSALRSGVHAAEADYPRGCPPSKKRGRDLFDAPEKGSRLFPFGFGVFMRTPFCRAVAGCPRPETFFRKKLVGPYLSYQSWEDLRAMITKILLLLGAPIRAIRLQSRSGRAFYRQSEFSF
jgi:hypothetical protein